jgi:hypothetical protein
MILKLTTNDKASIWVNLSRILQTTLIDAQEGYRKLRLEPLFCPHRLSRGTAPHEREYPRRKDRF